MELLNLHLTGDFHAVTAAHNLLSAMVDNHLHQGNALDLDLHNITWRRVLDVNDRALRNIIVGLGAKADGVPRQTGFDITAASEVMAILALSTSPSDLRARLGRIVVGYNSAGESVTAEQLKGAGVVLWRQAVIFPFFSGGVSKSVRDKFSARAWWSPGPCWMHTCPAANCAFPVPSPSLVQPVPLRP
jgi:formate--tetrahydrofolate ligase